MRFDEALDLVLKNEAGFVNDPDDRGGATNYGITQKTLSDYMSHEVTVDDVRNIPMDVVRKIYKQEYWDRLKLDHVIDKQLAFALFDQCVNRGIRRVAEQIQEIVGVKVDGVIGPITIKAINAFDSSKAIIEFVKKAQISYIRIVEGDKDQLKFLRGWITRTHQYL